MKRYTRLAAISATTVLLATASCTIVPDRAIGSDNTRLSTESAIAGLDFSIEQYYKIAEIGEEPVLDIVVEETPELAPVYTAVASEAKASLKNNGKTKKTPDLETTIDKEDAAGSDDTAKTGSEETGIQEQEVKEPEVKEADAAQEQEVKDPEVKEPEVKEPEVKEPEVKEPEVTKPVSKYENMGISVADRYVNIRKSPDTDSEILGKLYRGAAATIVARPNDEWVEIKSGKVKGYINSEYLAIGFDAEELESKFGTKYATVNTRTLNVRAEMSTSSKILTQIPVGEVYEVGKEYDEWIMITIDDGDLNGYVSKEYMDITVKFPQAISIEEEQEQKRREEEARKAEEERLKKLAEEEAARKAAEKKAAQEKAAKEAAAKKAKEAAAKKAAAEKAAKEAAAKKAAAEAAAKKAKEAADKKAAEEAKKAAEEAAKEAAKKEAEAAKDAKAAKEAEAAAKEAELLSKAATDDSKTTKTSSNKGSDVVAYALKFVGNPYVWGGTSLTKGTDCSGFTMSVYAAFGYKLPHQSRSQVKCGTKVEVNEASLKPGDLLFYTNSSGTINHVAMYMGNGKVVHASNPRDGIKTSRYNYRTPCAARRIIN